MLLDALKKIKGNPEKHKPSDLGKISAQWDLRDREKAKFEIMLAAQNNLERFQQKDIEKRDWNAVVITGAAGSGKTRLCHDSFGWIEKGLSGSVSRVLSVFITFLNGEQLTSTDSIPALDTPTQASIAVGIRVACKLFPLLGVCDFVTLRSLRIELGKLQELCNLPTVMRACSLHLQAFGDSKLPVWVTMALDESHFAEHPEVNGAPIFWSDMMSAIMQYVIPGGDQALCLNDNVVLFPIISGTWSVERQKYHWSPGVKIFAPLPPLSVESAELFVKQAGQRHPHIALLWDDLRMRHFLVSCALIPDGLALALETAIRFSDVDRGELTKQVCNAFCRRFKPGTMLNVELAELALSGVVVRSLDALVDSYSIRKWLEWGFASCDVGEPVSIPFPALFNDAGTFVPGISQFTNFGQPFHWQDFEALVPYIIRLRCSSLCRLKGDHLATLAEIFGSGPSNHVQLVDGMAVVTCSNQWLVPKRGKVKTVAQQLKVANRDSEIEVGREKLTFGSLGLVFAAADGNVHFDGHLSFVTVDGRSVLICYQAKHTHITNKKKVKHFTWMQVEEWLNNARSFMSKYEADVKLFVMVTNKEVRDIPAIPGRDFVLIHQGNLGSFFAPCLLASATLAHDDPRL